MSFGLEVSTDRQRHPKFLTKEDRGKLHEREKEINKLTRREVKGMLNKNICFFKLGKKFKFNRSIVFGRLDCFCERARKVLFASTKQKQYNEQGRSIA